jgi:hypothetical protein
MTEIEFQIYVEEIAHQCVDILIAEKLVKRPKTFKRQLVIQTKAVRKGWGGLTRRTSKGTRKPRITIPKRFATASGLFPEYKSFENDQQIGSFHSDNPKHHICAIVAHEVAHAADHWSGDFSSHGSEWRGRYRLLRKKMNLVLKN